MWGMQISVFHDKKIIFWGFIDVIDYCSTLLIYAKEKNSTMKLGFYENEMRIIFFNRQEFWVNIPVVNMYWRKIMAQFHFF